MTNTEDLGARVFGARIRARRSNDLTLNELAVRAGYRVQPCRRSNAVNRIHLSLKATGLSRALGVDVGELLAAPEVVITPSDSIPAHSRYGRGTWRRDLPGTAGEHGSRPLQTRSRIAKPPRSPPTAAALGQPSSFSQGPSRSSRSTAEPHCASETVRRRPVMCRISCPTRAMTRRSSCSSSSESRKGH